MADGPLESLRKVAKRSLPTSVASLTPQQRRLCVEELQGASTSSDLPIIEALFNAGTDEDRKGCIFAASGISTKRSRAFLRNIIATSGNSADRSEAAMWLGHIAKDEDVDFLLRIVLDASEEENLRDRAVDTIGDIFECDGKSPRLPDIQAFIGSCLSDHSPCVRYTACFVAAKLNFTSLVPKMEEMARDDHELSMYGLVSEQALQSVRYLRKETEDIHGERKTRPRSWQSNPSTGHVE